MKLRVNYLKLMLLLASLIVYSKGVELDEHQKVSTNQNGDVLEIQVIFCKLINRFPILIAEKLPEQLEDDIVQKLYAVIEHYKQDSPVGLPVVPIPDPMVKYTSESRLSVIDVISHTI